MSEAKKTKQPSRPPSFVPGKLHIKFKPEALMGAAAAVERGPRRLRAAKMVRRSDAQHMRDELPEQVTGPLKLLHAEFGVRKITPVLVPAPTQRRILRSTKAGRGVTMLAATVALAPRRRLAGYCVVELESDKPVPKETLNRIQASPAVEYVERAANRWTSAKKSKVDPELNLQWGLRAMEWFGVKRRPDARDVHVAILDTGVDEDHPDLRGAIAAYDHTGHSAKDLPGHGTHVAGIVAARANNGIGIAGVANCRLHVWKVFTDPRRPNHDEEFDDDAYNQALGAVLDSPARIVNLSLGGDERSKLEEDLIKALTSEGILVIAAMGNEYHEGNPTEFPAAYADVLGIGAISQNRRRWTDSNTGRHINLVAPGDAILSTVPGYAYFGREDTDYVAWEGTSMATPHVAGVAALLKAKYSAQDGAWIADRLQKTATKLAAMRRKSFTSAYGYGLVNVRRAL